MAYLLDSDVFVQAKNLHYGFDFCPTFWDWIDVGAARGAVLSIEKVRDELLAGQDQLEGWARNRGPDFFLTPDAPVLASLRATSNWASSAEYTQGAINVFLGSADYYLVAHAHAHGHVAVTHERPSGGCSDARSDPDVSAETRPSATLASRRRPDVSAETLPRRGLRSGTFASSGAQGPWTPLSDTTAPSH